MKKEFEEELKKNSEEIQRDLTQQFNTMFNQTKGSRLSMESQGSETTPRPKFN